MIFTGKTMQDEVLVHWPVLVLKVYWNNVNNTGRTKAKTETVAGLEAMQQPSVSQLTVSQVVKLYQNTTAMHSSRLFSLHLSHAPFPHEAQLLSIRPIGPG